MKKIVCFFIFFYTFSGYTQPLNPIQTDRPDQTECPFIVPINYIQIENGFTIENENIQKKLAFPTTLLKYGINDKAEIRMITALSSLESEKIGLLPITFGFKLNLLKEKGILPTTSLITHLTSSNIGSRKYQSTYLAPSFRFTMQHTLSEKATLGYNIGEEWNGETPDPTFIYTLTIGYSLPSNFGSYIEMYGTKPHQQNFEHKFDGGLTYLVGQNLLFDISGSIGLSKIHPSNYISLGCSFRFNTIRSTK